MRPIACYIFILPSIAVVTYIFHLFAPIFFCYMCQEKLVYIISSGWLWFNLRFIIWSNRWFVNCDLLTMELNKESSRNEMQFAGSGVQMWNLHIGAVWAVIGGFNRTIHWSRTRDNCLSSCNKTSTHTMEHMHAQRARFKCVHIAHCKSLYHMIDYIHIRITFNGLSSSQ